jgi:hypothetical protein
VKNKKKKMPDDARKIMDNNIDYTKIAQAKK